MAEEINGQKIRKVLLDVVDEMSNRGQGGFQQLSVLREASARLELRGVEQEQALLTYWYDLFRTGYLAWGYNLSNPDPPFCHLTDQGRRTLKNLSRDPANPDGYLAFFSKLGLQNSIAESYLKEALRTFNSDCFKASAVMIGAAAESITLELRDAMIQKIKSIGKTPSKDLQDWRIKKVLDAIQKELEINKKDMSKKLAEAVESYWPAFTQQVRSTRNEVGHPKSIEPVTPDTVHAALLIFPELVRLALDIKSWILAEYK
ncbi:MAG: hypothetical protein ACFFDT_28395 [Candidatus Hodarchaeota archaeon]